MYTKIRASYIKFIEHIENANFFKLEAKLPPVYQAFYNRREIIPGVYFRVPYDMPNYTRGIFSRTV